jgi:ATP-dependent Clp protease ATP-binding subunit ClpA
VIQDEIKRPLTDELLFGKLAAGGTVRVDAADDKVTFSYNNSGPS